MIRALEKFNGNQTHAAKYLDISRKALRYRMEKYGISKKGVEIEEDENWKGQMMFAGSESPMHPTAACDHFALTTARWRSVSIALPFLIISMVLDPERCLPIRQHRPVSFGEPGSSFHISVIRSATLLRYLH